MRQYPSSKALLQLAGAAEKWGEAVRNNYWLYDATPKENPAQVLAPEDAESNLNQKKLARQLIEVFAATKSLRNVLPNVEAADPLDGLPRVNRLRGTYPQEKVTPRSVSGWSNDVSRAIDILKGVFAIVKRTIATNPMQPMRLSDIQGVEWAAGVLRQAANDSRGPGISKNEANQRACEALKNPKTRTVRTLAKAIGCSEGLILKLPAWHTYQEELERQGKKKPKARKAISLDGTVLDNKGKDDEELERLIADHQADFEESPLVSNARNHRRRPKV